MYLIFFLKKKDKVRKNKRKEGNPIKKKREEREKKLAD